jgi:hypothetical protein
LAATLLLASLTSCIFSPKRDDGDPGDGGHPQYPKLTDPIIVLDALKLAYEARDSVEIKLIYDGTYIGRSFDPNDQSALPDFTKQDEVDHVAFLHNKSSITSVYLTYPPIKTRSTDLADPPGWATVQMHNPGISVEINDSPTTYNLAPAVGTFEFKFIPTTPDSTSPTDTTWKIVRWTEFP